MEELSKYILDLLYLHNCVIIPNLGGFVGRYTSANIDELKGIIKPPAKNIVFNNNLLKNDGLLIHYIAQSKKLSYRASKQWLDNNVSDIKHTLITDGLVIIPFLGAFYLDKNEQIQFKVDVNKNLNGHSFGLNTLQLPIAKDQLQIVSHQNLQPMHSKKTLLKVAAILGPILLIAALIPFKNQIFKDNTQNAGLQPELSINKSANKKDTSVKEISTQKKQALFYSEQEKKYEYHLIVGSYKSKDNAQIIVNKLTKDGEDAYIVNQNGKYRVSIQKFEDRYKALKKLDFLRIKNKQIWMLKTEKNNQN